MSDRERNRKKDEVKLGEIEEKYAKKILQRELKIIAKSQSKN